MVIMMKSLRNTLVAVLMFSAPLAAQATPATDALFQRYAAEGAKSFSAETGKALWNGKQPGNGGKENACTDCHGLDLKADGKHAKTQKPIKPMAASANSGRYTQEKKVEKWFKRNCKWTWGRECTAQEKGDILTYLLAQ
jgi:hypothetical protein